MFLGEYQHSLDAKGRIFLPSKFRAQLEPGLVIAKGQDSCLYVFPRDEWGAFAERLRGLKLTSQTPRDFARLLFSGASEQVPDRQGRIAIPEGLRVYAGLERDAAVLGVGDRVEIWNRQTWDVRRTEMERQYSQMSEAHPDLPI